ncbi:hypothetical protein BU17DRAFT_8997, partial [Hysterangium stoloniferum]
LTIQHFILKSKALNLYRSAIRASRAIPNPTARKDTIGWIRHELERIGDIDEIDIIKSRLSFLRKDLKEILPSMGLPLS